MSYGIYAHEETFGRVDGKQVCELRFAMLRRDFKLKGFRQSDWEERDERDPDYFDISDEEFENLQREEIFDDDLQYRNMEIDDALD